MTPLTLYPHQLVAKEFLLTRKRCILADQARCGKTLPTAAAAIEHLPALVVCPAVAKPIWQKAFKQFGIDAVIVNGRAMAEGCVPGGVLIVNYDLLPYMTALKGWQTLVIDECFPEETLVSTPKGDVKINSLSCGDIVYTAHGIGVVEGLSTKQSDDLYLLEFDDGTHLKCTGNHPILTEKGWTKAHEMVEGESAYCIEGVLNLWESISSVDQIQRPRGDDCSMRRNTLENSAFLLKLLCEEIGKPNALRSREEIGVINFEGDAKQTYKAWREWARSHLSTANAFRNSRSKLDSGTIDQNTFKQSLQQNISESLQSGFGKPRKNDSDRSGWEFTPSDGKKSTGRKKGSTFGIVRLERISNIKQEGTRTVFNLQVSGHPSFYANGVLVHNCHRIKTPTAKRTKAAMKLMKATPHVFALSGTPVPNRPIEIWPLLSGLGIYKGSWIKFAYRYAKAWQSPWGFDVSGASNLPELKKALAPHVLRRTRADVFQNYQQPVISMIELDLPIDRREKQFDAEVLVQNPNLILALDGLSEIMREGGIRKVPLALDFIKGKLDDDPDESLVVFAWHKDVAAMLHDGLKDYQPVMVTGETPAADRQKHIDAFQSGEAKVIIGNIATLSEGVDLSKSSTVIFVEATWATSAFEQASARVENIQKFGIAPAVYILTTRNSLDHTILGKVLKKLDIIEQIL